MILCAQERLEVRELLGKYAMEIAFSKLCEGDSDKAMEVLERAIVAFNFLDQTDDVPDWVIYSNDLLKGPENGPL